MQNTNIQANLSKKELHTGTTNKPHNINPYQELYTDPSSLNEGTSTQLQQMNTPTLNLGLVCFFLSQQIIPSGQMLADACTLQNAMCMGTALQYTGYRGTLHSIIPASPEILLPCQVKLDAQNFELPDYQFYANYRNIIKSFSHFPCACAQVQNK